MALDHFVHIECSSACRRSASRGAFQNHTDHVPPPPKKVLWTARQCIWHAVFTHFVER